MYIFVNRFEDMEINSDIGGGALFGLTRPELDPTIYHTGVEHSNHFATAAVHINKNKITAV
jgi:hypothetical protein